RPLSQGLCQGTSNRGTCRPTTAGPPGVRGLRSRESTGLRGTRRPMMAGPPGVRGLESTGLRRTYRPTTSGIYRRRIQDDLKAKPKRKTAVGTQTVPVPYESTAPQEVARRPIMVDSTKHSGSTSVNCRQMSDFPT
ncbi:hypothetical protein L9F63_011538, partial [Diploptera punctata]